MRLCLRESKLPHEFSVCFCVCVFFFVCFCLCSLFQTGIENASYQYINARGNSLCTGTFSGVGSKHACAIPVFNGSSIVVDIPRAYVNILGGRCSAEEDAIAPMWDAFRLSVQDYPTKKINGWLDQQQAGAGNIVLRPKLLQPVRQFAAGAGVHFGTLVSSMGSSALSCEALHASFSGAKSPFCCAVGTSLYWTIACIYLLAFTLLCCGTPSMLRARKRFPAHPWGPYARDGDKNYAKFPRELSAIPGIPLPMEIGQDGQPLQEQYTFGEAAAPAAGEEEGEHTHGVLSVESAPFDPSYDSDHLASPGSYNPRLTLVSGMPDSSSPHHALSGDMGFGSSSSGSSSGSGGVELQAVNSRQVVSFGGTPSLQRVAVERVEESDVAGLASPSAYAQPSSSPRENIE